MDNICKGSEKVFIYIGNYRFRWYPCTYNSLLYFAWTFYFYTVTKHTILFNSN